MKRDFNQMPPWSAAHTLVHSAGMITQAELELFDGLRDSTDRLVMSCRGDVEFSGPLDAMEESLNARFDAGHLVEMGEFDFSRDRHGNLRVWRGVEGVGLN